MVAVNVSDDLIDFFKNQIEVFDFLKTSELLHFGEIAIEYLRVEIDSLEDQKVLLLFEQRSVVVVERGLELCLAHLSSILSVDSESSWS